MIDMIRVGQTRNLLRASSSPLEIWSRSAHHHPGQRRHVSRTNRPDKSTHSITCPDDQKFLANRAASTKEGWISGPFPPPLAHCKPENSSLSGPFSLCVKGGVQIPSALRRLPISPRSVSGRPPSLSTRPSPPARQIQNHHTFQRTDGITLRPGFAGSGLFRCR